MYPPPAYWLPECELRHLAFLNIHFKEVKHLTVSENLLFQMYQMMDSVKLPEVTPSKSGKESEKSSFQDLMDQTRKDAAKTERSDNHKTSRALYRSFPLNCVVRYKTR